MQDFGKSKSSSVFRNSCMMGGNFDASTRNRNLPSPQLFKQTLLCCNGKSLRYTEV